jgi:hypothetical protein
VELFTEAYEKSIQVLKKWQATGKLPALLSEVALLLKQDGPDPSQVAVLEKVHEALAKEMSGGLGGGKGQNIGDVY